jgi:hypothetical protein
MLGLLVRIPPGAWMFVLCVLYSKDKKAQSGQRSSTDEVQRTNKMPVGETFLVSGIKIHQLFHANTEMVLQVIARLVYSRSIQVHHRVINLS